ncbi:hypothetical protein K501DRAFT_289154, partial [Backusella circina FSU 941]
MHEIKKKNVDFWITFVAENFESVEEAVRADIKGKGKAVEPTSAVDKVVGEKTSVPKSTDSAIRCCTVKVESILRRDIPSDMNDHISDTLNRMLHEVTDYSIRYGIRLISLILLLKDYTFDVDDESISLEPDQDFSVSDILPQGYKVAANTSTVPPPLNGNSLNS